MGQHDEIAPAMVHNDESLQAVKESEREQYEVFQKDEGVDFRTVSWPVACIIFLKITFALGILSIPTALYTLGAVGGALSMTGWLLLNTYMAVVQGNFKARYPQCHTLADMGYVMGKSAFGEIGGVVVRELIGAIFLVAYILCIGGGIIGLSVAFNALSDHGACTVWFAFAAFVLITMTASIRTLHQIGWLTWAGFISLFAAVFIIVIGVTLRSRPAAAPQTGPFELGFHAIAYPAFADAMTATATLFISSAGTSAMLPVISEMRNPLDYRKALYVCMGLLLAMYLSFAMVVYAWTGQYLTNPALGSAGGVLKKVSYGIALVGLIVTGCIYQHIAAKYLFVRILRNSRHLQHNTVTHWTVWLSCSIGLGAISFILAESISIFNYILALAGSICFAPMAIIVPSFLWLHDHNHWRKESLVRKAAWAFHIFAILLGAFLTVAGTYSTILLIKDAYASGLVGSAFSCADNSGVTANGSS